MKYTYQKKLTLQWFVNGDYYRKIDNNASIVSKLSQKINQNCQSLVTSRPGAMT